MKIKKVEIQGFRAYKSKEDGTFDFIARDDKPSNFVAIYAPNGFGKSSFYDAVEWAVTDHLDRLAGEHNRQNHEYAAKSTKEKGVAQKILRNREIADNVPTYVNVYTTLPKPFKQVLRKTRSDSRDIRIGDTKSIKNAYFRKVLLSQDEIRRFLREAKPQDRYKRFMDSFGGDVEVLRQELSMLISDNRAVIAALEKRREELKAKLDEPVNVSVFEQFNETVLRVNAEGERIPLLDASFSTNSEQEVLSLLVSRLHALKSARDSRATLRDTLIEHRANAAEVELHLDWIAEQQPKLAKLSKGVVDAERYQVLFDTHSKCLSELKDLGQQLDELIEIKSLIQVFLQKQMELASDAAKSAALTRSLADETAALEKLSESAKKTNDDLTAADANFSSLRNAVDNCSLTFSEIQAHEGKVLALSSQAAEMEVALRLDRAQHEIAEAELSKVSSLNITAQCLLDSDVSVLNFAKLKLDQLNDFSKALEALKLHEQAILKTQSSLAEQMGLHERLIATGLQYLSFWPTSTCPLCQKPHESESSLRTEIENAGLLSSLSAENAEKLEIATRLKAELEGKVEAIVQEANAVQAQRLGALRKKLNELRAEINKKEQEKSRIDVEKKALAERLDSLQASVLRLSKEDFVSRAEAELARLREKRIAYLELQTKLNGEIDTKKSLIAELDSSVKELHKLATAIISDSAYQKVQDYAKGNGLLPAELNTYCTQRVRDLEKLREERRTEANELVSQTKALHEVMLADGTWVDFSLLASQKEQAQIDVARSEVAIKGFYESVSRIIGSQDSTPFAELKNTISESIESQIVACQRLEEKVKIFELLSELLEAVRPYLTHLSHRAMLVEVEKDIGKRIQVGSVLEDERNLVVEELKRLIRGFFHEDLIESIYRKIDPHPSFKKVEFRPDFETADRPGLNIVLSENSGSAVSPILYFSAAQLNILSLSVFLAGALHAKDDKGNPLDIIMIDDPIQSMDSINVLATIDLLRSISVRLDKQIIISTHDDNFFGLLQRKVPSQVLGSKFLKLEKFGRVVPVSPITG